MSAIAKNPVGRPSEYTEERALVFCERLAAGQSLRSICRDDDMPDAKTIFSWMSKHPEFLQQYEKATTARATAMFEEMIDIADDGSNDTYETEEGHVRTDYDVIQRSKLRVDTRKWALARMNPRKYGERVTTELTGPGGGPIRSITTELTPKEAAEAWAGMLDEDK